MRENPDKPVYVCRHCRLQFIESRWKTEAELRDYYRTEYREHHEARIGVRFTAAQRFDTQRLLLQESARTFREKIAEGGSVLEIGCSSGALLDNLKGRHELYGLEWNPDDAKHVREELGIPCDEGLIEDAFPGKTFNTIIAIHVLEHQPDPGDFIRRVKKRLIGGGYLYLEVPNANDPLSAVYVLKEYQDFFYRDVHITYWLPHQLHWFLDSHGLEAQVSPLQRYGLLNHLNWFLNREPMKDPLLARTLLRPIPMAHPAAGPMNRLIAKLDREYRVGLQGLWASDSLVAVGRRLEI